MIGTILSHIIAALYLQKQKYNKWSTACFWAVYAIFSVCIMLFCENVLCGFLCMLLGQAFIFVITTIGPLGEKLFLFLTYSNSFCICIGANLILSALRDGSNHWIMSIPATAIVILMHIFLYKILLSSYKKSRAFFSNGWWKLNIVLIFYLIQFLGQYAFNINSSNIRDLAFNFVVFSIIFFSTLILIFSSVRDAAEVNKKTHENNKLKNVAYIDALTNVQNRAAYDRFTQKQELDHRRNPGVSFIISILDINGFKIINDTKGHAAGDEILKQVGAVINDFFEPYDCESFRYGGDEFVLLIKDMQLSYVENLIAKMNKELLRINNVTLSYGCSEVDFNNATPFHAALEKADAIMYSNKAKYYSSLQDLKST